MSLNIISKVDITELSKTMIDVIKEEEKIALKQASPKANQARINL